MCGRLPKWLAMISRKLPPPNVTHIRGMDQKFHHQITTGGNHIYNATEDCFIIEDQEKRNTTLCRMKGSERYR